MNTDCPHCGKKNDRHTSIGVVPKPHPGAITICIGCGESSLFDDDMHLRKLTPEEKADLYTGHPDVWIKLTEAKNFILNRRAQMN